jgi:hypothetical protein
MTGGPRRAPLASWTPSGPNGQDDAISHETEPEL